MMMCIALPRLRPFLGAAALLLTLQASAQTASEGLGRTDRWEARPQPMTVPAQYRSQAAVALFQDELLEVRTSGKEAYALATSHNRVKTLTDKGIEQYNKVYISMGEDFKLVQLKARTISPSGKVVDIPASALNEVEEEGRRFKIFAAEGLEAGSEVEYKYTMKIPLQVYGTEVFQRRSTPLLAGYFALITPDHLKYELKPYFGMETGLDTVVNKERILTASSGPVDALLNEPYSMADKYLRRVEYKLSYNLAQNTSSRLYTWRQMASGVYDRYFVRTSKEEKAVDDLLKQINLPTSASEEETILLVEDWVKTKINVNDELRGEEAESLDAVAKRRQGSEVGATRLMMGLFNKLNVKFQLGFVSPRDEMQMDQTFENYRRMNDLVIYFPGTGRSLTPGNASTRYPLVTETHAGGEALLLKITSLGNFNTAIPQFRTLNMEPADSHWHNLEVRMKLNEGLDTALLQATHIFKGYGALPYRAMYHFLNQEKQQETTNELISGLGGGTSDFLVTNTAVRNAELTHSLDNAPLLVSGDLKAAALVERAGNRLLLKVGELIGKQTNIYDSSGKPRSLPIELGYPHVLNRSLHIALPAGYNVQNLKDANLSSNMKDGDSETAHFRSTARQEGNELVVDVLERYDRISYPLQAYPQFVDVINAAANFNKVVLVLVKQ